MRISIYFTIPLIDPPFDVVIIEGIKCLVSLCQIICICPYQEVERLIALSCVEFCVWCLLPTHELLLDLEREWPLIDVVANVVNKEIGEAHENAYCHQTSKDRASLVLYQLLMVLVELISVIPHLLLEVNLVVKLLVPLFLDLVLPIAFLEGQFERSIEHIETSRELKEVIYHLVL